LKILFVHPVAGQNPTFVYGIGSLSAVLKAEGHETSLLKLINSNYDSACEAIGSAAPDLMAISCTSLHWPLVKDFSRRVKEQFSIPIFVGGSHTTMFPESLLETESIDGVCRGEGELALLELINRLNKGSEYPDVANFWFRKNGEIIQNEVRSLIDDLNKLPIADRSIFPAQDILNYTNFTFSRGCPYNCSYCCNSTLKSIYKGKGAAIRFRSVANALEEIGLVVERYHPHHLFFDDDTFVKNGRWLEEFCSEYPRHFNVPFSCNARPELITRKIAGLMKSAGCAGIIIGVESGDEALRKQVLNRSMTDKQIIESFDIARESGLQVSSFNMIGIPGETPAGFQKTIKLNQIIRPDTIQLSTYYPFPGSALGDMCYEKGYIKEEVLSSTYNYFEESVLQLPDFSNADINRLRRRFQYNVYRKYSLKKALLSLLSSVLPARLKGKIPSPLIKLYSFFFR